MTHPKTKATDASAFLSSWEHKNKFLSNYLKQNTMINPKNKDNIWQQAMDQQALRPRAPANQSS